MSMHRIGLPFILALIFTSAAVQCTAISLGEGVALPLEGSYGAPRWSPRGGQLALSGPRANGLFSTDMTGNLQAVSNAPMSGMGFAWSPDGQNLAFRARQEGSKATALMVSGPDGQTRQITPYVEGSMQARWGKDGLTYKAGDELVTVDAKGNIKNSLSLSQGRGLLARIMNVSAMMISTRITGATLTALPSLPMAKPPAQAKNAGSVFTDSESQPWIVDENGEMRKLIDVAEVDGYHEPVAAPGEDKFAVQGFDDNLYIADRSGLGQLSLGPGGSPTWSPDGRFLIYTVSADDGHVMTSSELWIANADGSNRRMLSTTPGVKTDPAWSPDGRSVAYVIDGVVYVAPIMD